MAQAKEPPSIPELFNGKSVLVTGATGFLGKVLVEKLLRSCPGIKELFLLLRPSVKGGNADVAERLSDFKEHPVFAKLRKDQPGALEKLTALSGSIELDNLGLTGKKLKKVTSNVSFIFHCAANVRFDDEPSNTFSVNLLGVKNVLDICRLCTVLEAFVHTSTAYAYTIRKETLEEVYEELIEPEHMIEILGWMSNEQLRFICKSIDQGRQSFYQFSKALAENLIVDDEDPLPAIIVRPSIVTASVKEPYPGWVDNYNGPTGFIVVCGKGIVKTLLVDPSVKADWVPVDIVANTLIVAAHYVAVKSKLEKAPKLDAPSGVPIINCTCPPNNAITWRTVVDICLPNLIKYPSMEIYGRAGGTVTASKFQYALCRLMSHHIPAYFIDGILRLLGKRPQMVRLYKNIHRVMGHLEHYTTHSYTFHSPNMRRLIEQMSPADAELFPIDQSVLDWDRYIEDYVLGTRRYYLEERDDTLPIARMRMMRMHYLCMAVKTTSMFGIFLLIFAFRKRLLPSFNIPIPSIQFPPIMSLLRN